jgi:hypothetical protein
VNANNKTLDVNWEKSYANADKTKTYCVYTAPNAQSVRDAAKLNGLPVDVVTEIPSDIKAEPTRCRAADRGRQPSFPGASATARPTCAVTTTRKFGVSLLTSYGTADKLASYWVYQAPSFSAVESAAKASGAPFESIVEIPETLYPY